jgi:hypothetical protein
MAKSLTAEGVIHDVERMIEEALYQERTGDLIDVTDGLSGACKGFTFKGLDIDQAILDDLYDGRNDSDLY